MPVDVTTKIEIARPVGEVAQFACDPDNATKWYKNIKAVEWRSGPALQVGTELAFVARFLRRDLAYTYRVEAYEPDRLFVMRTAQGPFPMETTYTFEATTSGGTLMRLRNRGEPSGFSKLLAPLMAVSIRRANRKDLARLRAVLEP